MSTFRGLLFYCYLALSLVALVTGVLITTPFTSSTWRYEVFCRPWARMGLWAARVLSVSRLLPSWGDLPCCVPCVPLSVPYFIPFNSVTDSTV